MIIFSNLKRLICSQFSSIPVHSSRMRTGRSLTVCCSVIPGEGCACSGRCLLLGVCLFWEVSAPGGVPGLGGVCSGGVPGLGGGVCSQGVCLVWEGCVCSRGLCLVWGGVCSQGGVCSWGCIPACTEADTSPLWTEFLTHDCENITLAQLRCSR